MGWFKRNTEGITTSSAEKKEIPEGAWYQLEIAGTEHAVEVKINGLVVSTAERTVSDGPLVLDVDGGWIDIEAIHVEAMR